MSTTQRQSAVLPPDGTIIRVSEWRRQVLWAIASVFAFLALCILAYAAKGRQPAAVLGALGYGLAAAIMARSAMGGIILGEEGIKGRTTLRTYHWRWHEIERFELKIRGETPRFRVHLRDGQVRGFLGFFARTSEEEARAEKMFQALQDRLRTEQGQGLG